MKTEITDIIYILDKSRSMESLRDTTIHAFNGFLQDQKCVPGDARLTLVLFSSDIEVLYNGIPLRAVPLLTRNEYSTSRGTALYDAVCHTIDTVETRILELTEEDKPSRVIYVIHTDGEESASKVYTRDELISKIAVLNESDARDVIFLGASLEAIHDARDFGVAHSMQYEATDTGTINAFANISKAVTQMRGLPKTNLN